MRSVCNCCFFALITLEMLSVFFGVFLRPNSLWMQNSHPFKLRDPLSSIDTPLFHWYTTFFAIISSHSPLFVGVWALFIHLLLVRRFLLFFRSWHSLCKVENVHIWTLGRSFTTAAATIGSELLITLKSDLNESFQLPTPMSFLLGCQQDTLFSAFPLSPVLSLSPFHSFVLFMSRFSVWQSHLHANMWHCIHRQTE